MNELLKEQKNQRLSSPPMQRSGRGGVAAHGGPDPDSVGQVPFSHSLDLKPGLSAGVPGKLCPLPVPGPSPV